MSDKLTPLHDKIYCCRSGSAADTQALSDYARRALSDHALVKGGPPTVAAAAHVFRKMCYSNKDRLLAGIIVAGWDAVQGGQVYEIPLGGTCVRGNVALGGSGSTYIHGFVDSAFRPGECRGRGAGQGMQGQRTHNTLALRSPHSHTHTPCAPTPTLPPCTLCRHDAGRVPDLCQGSPVPRHGQGWVQWGCHPHSGD